MQAMFPINPAHDITALILAGGKARRLGGQDKGLIQLANRPLIEHVLDKLRPQTGTIMINANRHQDRYRQYGYPVIADSLPDFAGPLAGLLTGLENMTTEWLVTVPCDNPHLPDRLVQTLVETANQQECLLTVASCKERLQPVYCLLHRSLQSPLADFLVANKHKAQDWVKEQDYCMVEFDNADAFENINTPEQLAEAEKHP